MAECFKLKNNEKVELFCDADLSNENFIKLKGDGQNIVLLFYSDNEADVYIRPGDGVFAGKQQNIYLPGGYYAVKIESGPYLHHSGPYKGGILMGSEESVSVCVLELS